MKRKLSLRAHTCRGRGKGNFSFISHINILLQLQIHTDAKIFYVAKWCFYFAAHVVHSFLEVNTSAMTSSSTHFFLPCNLGCEDCKAINQIHSKHKGSDLQMRLIFAFANATSSAWKLGNPWLCRMTFPNLCRRGFHGEKWGRSKPIYSFMVMYPSHTEVLGIFFPTYVWCFQPSLVKCLLRHCALEKSSTVYCTILSYSMISILLVIQNLNKKHFLFYENQGVGVYKQRSISADIQRRSWRNMDDLTSRKNGRGN